VVVAGFLLWGYPAAAPIDLSDWWVSSHGWFGTTPDGYPAVNPIGNFLGAIIMFGVLGFLPTYVVAKLFHAKGLLREPREVELAGADSYEDLDVYPNFAWAESEFDKVELGYADK
jgi:hypothetical protein